MLENVDGRVDAGVTGILLAHPRSKSHLFCTPGTTQLKKITNIVNLHS